MSQCRRYKTTSTLDKFVSISLMEWQPISLPRPRAKILKMASHEPITQITQPIIDRFGQTDDRLWKPSRFPTLMMIDTMMIDTCRPLTLSLECPTRAIASCLILPPTSIWMERAFDVAFVPPRPSGYCATCTSGKAPPSEKSCTENSVPHLTWQTGGQRLQRTPRANHNTFSEHFLNWEHAQVMHQNIYQPYNNKIFIWGLQRLKYIYIMLRL